MLCVKVLPRLERMNFAGRADMSDERQLLVPTGRSGTSAGTIIANPTRSPLTRIGRAPDDSVVEIGNSIYFPLLSE
jgi:hypothetical protein